MSSWIIKIDNQTTLRLCDSHIVLLNIAYKKIGTSPEMCTSCQAVYTTLKETTEKKIYIITYKIDVNSSCKCLCEDCIPNFLETYSAILQKTHLAPRTEFYGCSICQYTITTP